MKDRTGQQLGNYRLERQLGFGGFAEVYLAEHIHLQTHAAIKILLTHLVQRDLERFKREAKMIASLEHPNLIRVLDFGIEQDTPFLVMNYAPQGTLRQRHPKGTQVPLETVLTYVSQVASALHYAHQRNIVHRDVKPENILVGNQGEILLSDFGIAVTEVTHQQTNTTAGTAAYMAPEQMQGKATAASDQYALAIVIFEWLAGEQPYKGSFFEICMQHMQAPLPSLQAFNPTVPILVEQCLQKALAKQPEQRFANILEFAQALQSANNLNATFQRGAGGVVLPQAQQTDPTQTRMVVPQANPATLHAQGTQMNSITPRLSQDNLPIYPVQHMNSGNYPQISHSQLPTMRQSQSNQDMPTIVSTGRQADNMTPRVSGITPIFTSNPSLPTVNTGPSATFPQHIPYANPIAVSRPQKQNNRRTISVLLLVCLLLLVALSAFPLMSATGILQAFSSANNNANNNNQLPKHTATSTATSIATATATATPSPTATVAPTQPPSYTAFSVITVHVHADLNNYKGQCAPDQHVILTGTIGIPAGTEGGRIDYYWLLDNYRKDTESVHVGAGETQKTVTTQWELGAAAGDGTEYKATLYIISPNYIQSHPVVFSFICTNGTPTPTPTPTPPPPTPTSTLLPITNS